MRFVSGIDRMVDAKLLNPSDAAGRFSAKVDNPNAVATFGAGVMVMSKGNLDVTLQHQGGFAHGDSARSGALKSTLRF